MPPIPALSQDPNSVNVKGHEADTSVGTNNEKQNLMSSQFYTSGTKSKVRISDVISSGFSSCKDLSPKHSTRKQTEDLFSSQQGRKSTTELYNNQTTLVNPNFAPPYSFESENMVRQSSNSPDTSLTIQSSSNVTDGGQLHSLPSNSDATPAATMSFSIPQLNFQSYFSKNNVSSFLFNNSSQTKMGTTSTEGEKYKKDRKSSNSSSSPYTFFQMESDDDFDFDVVDDINNPQRGDQDLAIGGCSVGFNDTDDDELEDLGAGRSRWYNLANGSNNDRLISGPVNAGEKQACLSQSSSIISMPVCRICQLPGMEPANHLISPCRCLGSIRYVHNNCLLVSIIPFVCIISKLSMTT